MRDSLLFRSLIVLALCLLLAMTLACRDDDSDDDRDKEDTAAAVEDSGKSDRDDDDRDYASGMAGGDYDMEEFMQLIPLFTGLLEAGMRADAASAAPQGSAQDTGIHVLGAGSVSAAPDLVELTLGVESTAETVSAARDEAATALSATIAALLAGGVLTQDIQTEHISIHPQYDWVERIDEGIRRSERVLTGYVVSNTVRVLVRELSNAGELLDAAVAAGGDAVRVNGISFRIEDSTELAQQARELAVEDAMVKAQELADHSGVTLGAMVYLTEVSAAPAVRDAPFALAADTAGESTPISGGQQEVTVTVRAVFSIQGNQN